MGRFFSFGMNTLPWRLILRVTLTRVIMGKNCHLAT